jgi:hypothetical protein
LVQAGECVDQARQILVAETLDTRQRVELMDGLAQERHRRRRLRQVGVVAQILGGVGDRELGHAVVALQIVFGKAAEHHAVRTAAESDVREGLEVDA